MCIYVDWITVQGIDRCDIFTTPECALARWGAIYPELSWVHAWNNPRDGVINFLKELPLTAVNIREM